MSKKPDHFIEKIIKQDIASGKIAKTGLITRFPPEPNGYLHIGHAKAICLNFGLAQEFGGRCHLRFDDTNPETAKMEYIQAIQEDIQWLGFDWGNHLYYASDYFQQLYEWAQMLIKKELAFVDDSTPSDIQKMRGSLTVPGQNSPFRGRSVEENLDLFEKMKKGEFEEGSRVLRAKIDMSSGNMNFRDPILYRILKKTPHPRTGHQWSVYPTYDFAHGQSDAIEKITHSLCTLEFKDHNPLYAWFLDKLEISNPPRQYEFARLNLDHTILSKRHLLDLVEKKQVNGWDDPRMPTLKGLRHRGYPAESLKELCHLIGVTTANSTIGLYNLEDLVRKKLNQEALRLMAVIDPVQVTITNGPKSPEILQAKRHPKKDLGQRDISFSKDILIERNDLRKIGKVGSHVRLKYAYVIRCDQVIKNQKGQIMELKCSYYQETKGGKPPDDKRGLKGGEKPPIIHWVCAKNSCPIEVHDYDRLFWCWEGNEGLLGSDLNQFLNMRSHQIKMEARLEQDATGALAHKDKQTLPVQFERQGYYTLEVIREKSKPVFHQVISLRDLSMPPHVFHEHLYKQKNAIVHFFQTWLEIREFYWQILEKCRQDNKAKLNQQIYQTYAFDKPYVLVVGLMSLLETTIHREKDDPSWIQEGLGLLNRYIVMPHRLVLKDIQQNLQPSLSQNLSDRFEALKNLLWSCRVSSKVRSSQKELLKVTDFLEENENGQLCIPMESTTECLVRFIKEQLIGPLRQRKNSYTHVFGQKDSMTLQKDSFKSLLRETGFSLVKYFYIIYQLKKIHFGYSFSDNELPLELVEWGKLPDNKDKFIRNEKQKGIEGLDGQSKERTHLKEYIKGQINYLGPPMLDLS